MTGLTIIQTADLHSNIDLAKAGRLRNLRVEREALLVDCGDAVWAGNVFVKPGPEHAIRRMNEAGYHAMALGNREYFFRAFGMMMKTAEARFPVLSANLLPVGGSLGHIRRWVTIEAPGGARVGLFGLTPLMIPPGSWMELVSNTRFISHTRAAREAIAALRRDCDWLVCLSHAGIEVDRQIADTFDQIDLILGGHTHLEAEEMLVVNGVPISHVGAFGRRAGIIACQSAETREGRLKRELVALEGNM